MLQLAGERVPGGVFVCADVPPLRFLDDSFDTAFISHLYGHLELQQEREAFLNEAFRVAGELIIVEQAWRPGLTWEGWEDRRTSDGTQDTVYKRYFTAADLANEIGGRIILDTSTFVAAIADRTPETGARKGSAR